MLIAMANRIEVRDKCIKDDDALLAFDEKSKLVAWKSHYANLLNIESPWDSSNLSREPPFQGPPIKITTDKVTKALMVMKIGKATGPRGSNVKIILAGAMEKVMTKTHLVSCVIDKVKSLMILDAVPFGFMPGRGTSDAIFIL